jgi:ABC-type multidrug transport system ATPase subunit
MFSLIAGKQGCGKTKTLIEMANERAKTSNGSSVFIDDDKRHVYDLPHKVRYISTQDLPIQTPQEFFGFICGLMASDYDLENLYIDGLKKTMKGSLEEITEVAKKIEIFSEISNVDVVATISSEVEDLTEGLKEFLLA